MNSPHGGPWAALCLLLAAGCSTGLNRLCRFRLPQPVQVPVSPEQEPGQPALRPLCRGSGRGLRYLQGRAGAHRRRSAGKPLGDFQLRANLYYYRATPALYPGQQLQDEDWFWLQVPPQRVANLLITQVGLPPGSEHTYVCFYRTATTPIQVVNNQLVALANPSPEPQRIVFKLYLEPADFILEPSLGGGIMVDYTIVLHSVVGQ